MSRAATVVLRLVSILPLLVRSWLLLEAMKYLPRTMPFAIPFPRVCCGKSIPLPASLNQEVWTTLAPSIYRSSSRPVPSLFQPQRLRTSRAFSSSSPSHDESSSDSSLQLRQARHSQLQQASKLQLAPMMDYTDRHFRHVVRLISSHTLLYTEMVAANALAHERRLQQQQQQQPQEQQPQQSADGDRNGVGNVLHHHDGRLRPHYNERFLAQGCVEPLEGPSVLQLGGSSPELLYEAAQAVLECDTANYTAFNLNCGCPSPKVANKGCFGAALMDDPTLVAQLVRALHEGGHGQWPVSVKCRIGTDSMFPSGFRRSDYTFGDAEYGALCHFVETVAADGIVTDFGIHARIAVLSKSFSPADNRKIPPLEYDIVRRLVADYPELRFTLNGGVETLDQVREQLEACPSLAGVMVGRALAADPWSFAMADEHLYSGDATSAHSDSLTRLQVLEAYGKHADYEESMWDPVKIRRFLVKAVTPLFAGEPNAKKYRIALDEIAQRPKRWAKSATSNKRAPRDEPPLSELLLGAAHEHLDDETLLRTPRESFEMRQWLEQEGRRHRGSGSSATIAQWQAERKQDPDASYDRTLHHLDEPVEARE